MSCNIYWDRLLEISNTLNEFKGYEIKNLPLDRILPLLEGIEEIAHDTEIQFDSAKHILNDEKMGPVLYHFFFNPTGH